jgi:hypothetical protein
VVVSVFASITGLHCRAAMGFSVAGLVLGVPFGVLLALDDLVTAAAVAILATTAVFTFSQWG